MKSQDSNLDLYFQKAVAWYNQKHLLPITHRSYILCVLALVLLLLSAIFLQMYNIFPVEIKLKYAVSFRNSDQNKKIAINPANDKHLGALKSIARILVENYVEQREQYYYPDLKKQIIFVQNSSTKALFDGYYNFIKIENQLSPVLRYQDQIKREIQVLITIFSSDNSADIQFRSIARDANDRIKEQMLWQASIDFKIDPILLNQPDGTKFNFLVTGYKVKLIKDETKNANT